MRALLLLPLIACAAPARLGRVEAHEAGDLSPGSRAREIDVLDGGLEMRWVGGYAAFRSAPRDACSHVEVARSPAVGFQASQAEKIQLCPSPDGTPGRWHAEVQATSFRNARAAVQVRDSFEYDVIVLTDGCLSVYRPGASWRIQTPGGPVGDALRAHPEMLGAAAALGLLPLAGANNIALAVVP